MVGIVTHSAERPRILIGSARYNLSPQPAAFASQVTVERLSGDIRGFKDFTRRPVVQRWETAHQRLFEGPNVADGVQRIEVRGADCSGRDAPRNRIAERGNVAVV